MYAEEIKVVILGNSGVGKSSIMMRFVKDEFSATQPTTMGAAFMSKIIKTADNQFKFQIWDTAGQEKYKSLAPLYYREARIGIVVYDITSLASFGVLKTWITELQKQGPENLILAIVGNKSDLQDKQEVPYEDAMNFAKQVDALFELTSAKENRGINDLFMKLANKIELQKIQNSMKKNNQAGQSFAVNSHPNNKQGSCPC
ncbi:hypothetical protein ABPG74_019021 [Tetrahymena malaccensis]